MRNGFPRPKKNLGQNFLSSEEVLDQFIAACDLNENDVVVEVGAGMGVITAELAKRVRNVIAFELDSDLIPSLRNLLKLQNLCNVEIRNEDVLKSKSTSTSISTSVSTSTPISKIVGAIPYQITSPLLHKIILEFEEKPTIVFIVQKEVAEKITAKPPHATYLSNFVSLYGKAEIVGLPISPLAFYPAPKVESAILKITPDSKFYNFTILQFSKFLHHGFKNPRKMLNKAFPAEVLKKAGVDPALRPQNLTLEDWMRLSDILEAQKSS